MTDNNCSIGQSTVKNLITVFHLCANTLTVQLPVADAGQSVVGSQHSLDGILGLFQGGNVEAHGPTVQSVNSPLLVFQTLVQKDIDPLL